MLLTGRVIPPRISWGFEKRGTYYQPLRPLMQGIYTKKECLINLVEVYSFHENGYVPGIP